MAETADAQAELKKKLVEGWKKSWQPALCQALGRESWGKGCAAFATDWSMLLTQYKAQQEQTERLIPNSSRSSLCSLA